MSVPEQVGEHCGALSTAERPGPAIMRRVIRLAQSGVDDPVLSTRDAAILLNVCEGTMARWRRAGTGPTFIRFSRTKVGYRQSALDAFLQGRERRSTLEDKPG